MTILDLPPPLYTRRLTVSSRPKEVPNLLALPDHLILQILAEIPLPSLALSVRLTNRKLLLFSSHLLRRALLPIYKSKIQDNFSSDATGLKGITPVGTDGGVTTPPSRELAVLDIFISACIHEAVRSHESELYILPSASTSAERDIFRLLQPRARVEDLLIAYGVQDEIIRYQLARPSVGDSTSVVAGDVSVQLLARSARLMLPFPSTATRGKVVMKCVVEVQRKEGERLERTAESLVEGLAKIALVREGGNRGWYLRG